MKIFLIIPALISFVISFGQMSNGNQATAAYTSFIDFQRTLTRPADAFFRKQDTLQKQFEAKGLKWPAKYVYIRSFKYDSQFEIWVKNDKKEPYKLFKTYKVCALAGTLGPKRMEGDYQVPEGFYYINEFNAKSTYHLSLGLNYPNASDRILSDSIQPGGEIYIHGSCVTVGCIPLTDPMIEEVYIITAYAKDQGQDFIPVHIFPIRYTAKRSVDYLNNLTKDDPTLKAFASRLEDAFNYFEKHKQLPLVMVLEDGEYFIHNAPSKKVDKAERVKEEPNSIKVKRIPVQHRIRDVITIPVAVHQWPTYPGGAGAYTQYLETLGKAMSVFLPGDLKKAHIQIEFIIDWDGMPVNFKILKGGINDEFNDELITQLEKTMQKWSPALLNDRPVPKKMVQSITVELP